MLQTTKMLLRRANERGHFDLGWLNTFHTFSFGHYFDREWMGFHGLRVINEDFVQPGKGFGEHGHQDMEILTYIIDGALEHRDSLGNGSEIRPGELQHMSAGSGIRHSEFNPSESQPVHLYQIWIEPSKEDLMPSYDQKAFPVIREQRGKLHLLASPDGAEGSLKINQDATLSVGISPAGNTLPLVLSPGRAIWLQVVRGKLVLEGNGIAVDLNTSDGIGLEEPASYSVSFEEESELMVFSLPG